MRRLHEPVDLDGVNADLDERELVDLEMEGGRVVRLVGRTRSRSTGGRPFGTLKSSLMWRMLPNSCRSCTRRWRGALKEVGNDALELGRRVADLHQEVDGATEVIQTWTSAG